VRKLQAAMRDVSAKKWRENTVMYRVGSVFKGCHHCGDYDVETSDSGREKKRYSSGFNVYRSYYPSRTHWTYLCMDCAAKDLQAWEGAIDIGLDAIVGARDAVRTNKMRLRKEHVQMETKADTHNSRESEIARLEAELAEVMALLKGGK